MEMAAKMPNAEASASLESHLESRIGRFEVRIKLHNQDLGNQAFYKPACLEIVLHGKAVIAQKEPKHQESHYIKYGGDTAHHIHKGHKGRTVPLMRFLQEFFVHIVPGNRNLSKVINQILN